MPIHFYYHSHVIPALSSYCNWWTFLEFTLNLMSELLMATISLQLHLHIFQGYLFRIRMKRYLFHYLPISFCVIYPLIFYVSIFVFYTCDGTQWSFTSNACGYAACYFVYSKVWSTFDLIANNSLPIAIIILANVTLIIRVIRQKRHNHQPISWQKQRRMALQLFSISSLYLFGWLPILIITNTQTLTSSSFLANIQVDFALDLIYFIYLLLPWICLGLLPELTKWIWRHLQCERIARNTIRPI